MLPVVIKPLIMFLQSLPISSNCSGCGGEGNSDSSLLLGEILNLFQTRIVFTLEFV